MTVKVGKNAHQTWMSYGDFELEWERLLNEHPEVVLNADLVDFGFNYLGAWNEATEYAVYDSVEVGGQLYVSIKTPNKGQNPTTAESQYWLSPGARGEKGEPGPEGPAGTLTEESVETKHLKALAVTEAKVAAEAISATKLKSEAVETAKIKALAVTEAKLGSEAVSEGKIKTGAVTEAKLGSEAVSEAKIKAGAVSESKLATAVKEKLTKTLRWTHTFTIPDEVKVAVGAENYIPIFFIAKATGQTVKVVETKQVIQSGTKAKVKLQKNGVDLTGFTAIEVTTTAGATNPADQEVADGDRIGLIVESIEGTPKNLSLSVVVETTV